MRKFARKIKTDSEFPPKEAATFESRTQNKTWSFYKSKGWSTYFMKRRLQCDFILISDATRTENHHFERYLLFFIVFIWIVLVNTSIDHSQMHLFNFLLCFVDPKSDRQSTRRCRNHKLIVSLSQMKRWSPIKNTNPNQNAWTTFR